MNEGMGEKPMIRADNVGIRCGECDVITYVGELEGVESESKVVRCSGCGWQHTVKLEVEA